MSVNCKYGFGCDVALNFAETKIKVEQLLDEKGFHIYTQLNLEEIIGDACRDTFGHYVIIGACNPDFARQLFLADPNIGLLMPCNIIIYENRSGGCRVMIKDPLHIMEMISSPIAIEASIQVKCMMEELVEILTQA